MKQKSQKAIIEINFKSFEDSNEDPEEVLTALLQTSDTDFLKIESVEGVTLFPVNKQPLFVYKFSKSDNLYDAYYEHIVIAESVAKALKIIPIGEEGADVWKTAKVEMVCPYYGSAKKALVLSSCYHAG